MKNRNSLRSLVFQKAGQLYKSLRFTEKEKNRMTTEKLSPDEINGLLGQGAEGKPMSTNTLLQVEKEALTELLTVSLGGSSTVLSTLFSEQAKVSTPT